MKKSILIIIGAMLCTLALAAQTVTVYDVPRFNTNSDYAPAIACNKYGDVLVFYTNVREGMMYYYYNINTKQTIGPAKVPFEEVVNDVENNDITTAANGDFLCTGTGSFWGLYFARFDHVTKQWVDQVPVRLTGDRIESAAIGENPVTKDIVIVFMEVISQYGAPNKQVFLTRKKVGGDWEQPFITSAASLGNAIPAITFDQFAHALVSYRTEFLIGGGDNLGVQLDLKDHLNNYKTIWSDSMTSELGGWQFIATTGVLPDGTALLTYYWPQMMNYFYIPMQIKANKVEFDWTTVADHILVPGPQTPWFRFYSMTKAYVDEFLFAYKTQGNSINLLRYKDGAWLMNQNVNLTNGESTVADYPFGFYVHPDIGVFTAWEVDGQLRFSYYDYKKIFIHQPVNVQLKHIVEKSFFSKEYMNDLTWENDSYNPEHNVVVSTYNIYRKPKDGSADYTKISEVAGTAAKLFYRDKNGVGAVNTFNYAVTAVDDKGNETAKTEVQ